MFTERELQFLGSQRMGRLATIGLDNRPHNVPVGLHYDATLGVFDVVGLNLGQSRKFRNVTANPWVSLVIDDVPETDPWTPWGIEVRGRALALNEGGRAYGAVVADELIRIIPERIVSWGIEAHWSAGRYARVVRSPAAD